jgi:ABC transporter substrate binding protein
MADLRRRQFFTLLGGAAAWPLAARAQQPRHVRRIGILMPNPKSDAESQSYVRAFRQELARLGWSENGNVQFDERWSTSNMDLIRADAANLVAWNPDAIVIVGDRVIPILTNLTRSIPIVVALTSDPIASGAVESLARPGHNVTGFSLIEFSIFGKMLEILKGLAPGISGVSMMYNPDNPVGPPICVRLKWLRHRLLFSRSICPFTILLTSNAPSQTRQSNQMAVFLFRPTLPSSHFASRWRAFWHATAFPQSPYIRRLPQLEDWSPTVRIEPQCFANPLPTSIVFCGARKRAICHFSSQRRIDLSSTSKPRRHSASRCPIRSS